MEYDWLWEFLDGIAVWRQLADESLEILFRYYEYFEIFIGFWPF